MYNTGVEIPRVSFSALSYSGIPANSYFMGFDLDNSGKLSKLDNTGTITVIEGGGGSGGGISLTDLSVNAPLTYNNITGVFNIGQSSGSTSGFLSSTDWNTFNNKQGALTLTTTGSSGAATLVGNTLNIPQYSGGGGGGGLTWPAHIHYNETDKTLWATGNTNVDNSTSYGDSALSTANSWVGNSAFGYHALKLNEAGWCSAFGSNALSKNTTGAQNSAFGSDALGKNTTGGANTAIGNGAMNDNTVGSNNTAVGSGCLVMCQGSNNTAVGQGAMSTLTTGTNNIALGRSTASEITTGTNNIGIGNSIWIEGSASNNTVIGHNAWAKTFSGSVVLGSGAIATGSNQFVIGSSSINAGTIVTESLSANRTWRVKINGTDYKVLLATV